MSPTDSVPRAQTAPWPWRVRPSRDVRGFLSPAVRRIAAERGVDARTVAGTGADGRVTVADVRAAVPGDRRVPLPRVRARAATALVASKREAAHAFVSVEVDFTGVERIRREIGGSWRSREGFALTYLPFVARAVVDALGELPMLNASVTGDEQIVHRRVGLGVAVDLDHEGLVVPVVHEAETLRLLGLARAIHDLAARARSGRLVPDDVTGSTFTITNPGAAGTALSVPVIHRPDTAILVLDGVRRRPVALESGPSGRGDGLGLAIRPVGVLGLSFDHRAVDGAYAGSFCGRVAEILERRDWSGEVGTGWLA